MNSSFQNFQRCVIGAIAVAVIGMLDGFVGTANAHGQAILSHQRRPLVVRCFGARANLKGPAVFQPAVPFGALYDSLPYWQGSNFANVQSSPLTNSKYPTVVTPYDSLYRGEGSADINQDGNAARVLNPAFHQKYLEERDGELAFSIISTLPVANTLQLVAERAFRAGRYSDAADLVDHATQLDSHNGMLRLFASQANFAAGNFRVAVTELESATQMLAPSQWNFFGKNFHSFYGKNDYVKQTRELTQYVKRRPDDYQAKVLLGYHLGISGHRSAATRLFHGALSINAGDELAQRLIPELGDLNMPFARNRSIDAPSPATVGLGSYGGYSHQVSTGRRQPPKRIYLTSQFAIPTSTPIEHVEAPMAPSELMEAPGDVIEPPSDFSIPALQGPAAEIDFDFPNQQHSIMEELPAPLEE